MMNNIDLISVIVPIYNVERYLTRCIESIINQTYKNIEIILIDDGSTDNSKYICQQYAKKDQRIQLISKKNEGVSSARNIGINLSRGKWIVFVDSDDWIDYKFCQKLYDEAIASNADIIMCGYNRIYEKKKEIINCKKDRITYNKNEYLIKILNVQNGYGFCHMKLIKKECIKNIRFDENIKVAEDALFNIKLVHNINKVSILGQALYNYVFNCNSVVRKYDEDYPNNYLRAMIQMKKYILKNFKENIEIQKSYYNYVAYHVLLIAVNYCFALNNKKIKEQIRKLREICNIQEFKEGIEKSNYKDLSISRLLTLFTLKRKLYILTAFICKFRQIQFKK